MPVRRTSEPRTHQDADDPQPPSGARRFLPLLTERNSATIHGNREDDGNAEANKATIGMTGPSNLLHGTAD